MVTDDSIAILLSRMHRLRQPVPRVIGEKVNSKFVLERFHIEPGSSMRRKGSYKRSANA